jgi:hypothetical protein
MAVWDAYVIVLYNKEYTVGTYSTAKYRFQKKPFNSSLAFIDTELLKLPKH